MPLSRHPFRKNVTSVAMVPAEASAAADCLCFRLQPRLMPTNTGLLHPWKNLTIMGTAEV